MVKAVSAAVSDRSRVKDRVVSAALKLYMTQGYYGTPLAVICERAGVPMHVVQSYFRDEAQVFGAILDRVRELIIEPVIEKIAKAPETAQEKLVAFIHAFSAVAVSQADLMILLIYMQIEMRGADDEPSRKLRVMVGHIHRTVEGIVKLGWMRSRFRTDLKSAEVTAFVVGAINGAMLEWYTRRDAIQGRELTRTFRLILTRGLEDFIVVQSSRDPREATPGFHP